MCGIIYAQTLRYLRFGVNRTEIENIDNGDHECGEYLVDFEVENLATNIH